MQWNTKIIHRCHIVEINYWALRIIFLVPCCTCTPHTLQINKIVRMTFIKNYFHLIGFRELVLVAASVLVIHTEFCMISYCELGRNSMAIVNFCISVTYNATLCRFNWENASLFNSTVLSSSRPKWNDKQLCNPRITQLLWRAWQEGYGKGSNSSPNNLISFDSFTVVGIW